MEGIDFPSLRTYYAAMPTDRERHEKLEVMRNILQMEETLSRVEQRIQELTQHRDHLNGELDRANARLREILLSEDAPAKHNVQFIAPPSITPSGNVITTVLVPPPPTGLAKDVLAVVDSRPGFRWKHGDILEAFPGEINPKTLSNTLYNLKKAGFIGGQTVWFWSLKPAPVGTELHRQAERTVSAEDEDPEWVRELLQEAPQDQLTEGEDYEYNDDEDDEEVV